MSDHAAAAGPQRTWRTAENRLFCLARKTVGRGKKLGPAVAAKGSRRSRPAIRPASWRGRMRCPMSQRKKDLSHIWRLLSAHTSRRDDGGNGRATARGASCKGPNAMPEHGTINSSRAPLRLD
jgi:hypothetical protein